MGYSIWQMNLADKGTEHLMFAKNNPLTEREEEGQDAAVCDAICSRSIGARMAKVDRGS